MPSVLNVTSQYIRCAGVVIEQAAGQTIKIKNEDGKGIRIAFTVDRSFDPANNTPQQAQIRLYNLSADTRHAVEGLKGIRAPVPASWSRAQLLASDADRNYSGPDAIVQNPDPLPGIELPADPVQSSTKFGYAYVRLFAGYNRKMGQIFEGTMLVPRSVKTDSTTWVTTLTAGDGALGATKAVANTSYPPGTEMIVVIRHLTRLLGVGPGNLDKLTWDRILAAGRNASLRPFLVSSKLAWSYTPSGASAWDDLAELLEASNVKWMVDQGQFWLLEPSGFLPGPPIDMGKVIGAVQEIGGGKFASTHFLNQNAGPARKITLASRDYKGEFICTRTLYNGDTLAQGTAFTTTTEFMVNDPLNLGLF